MYRIRRPLFSRLFLFVSVIWIKFRFILPFISLYKSLNFPVGNMCRLWFRLLTSNAFPEINRTSESIFSKRAISPIHSEISFNLAVSWQIISTKLFRIYRYFVSDRFFLQIASLQIFLLGRIVEEELALLFTLRVFTFPLKLTFKL